MTARPGATSVADPPRPAPAPAAASRPPSASARRAPAPPRSPAPAAPAPAGSGTRRTRRIDGLDGIRALAVIAVLLYHGGVSWAPGGFLGVDIFFVLSGFLVTSIVLDSFERTGSLDLRRFWTGRVRRLGPAQVAVIAVLAVTVALWHANELADVRAQAFAALTGTTNWYLMHSEASYFGQLGRPPLLQHLWSLGVEIQFYLVFPPLLLLALYRWRDRLDRIVLAIGVAIALSAIYLALLVHPGEDPSRGYYDTFARLSAPLIGAALALIWRPARLDRAPVREHGRLFAVAGSVALVGILVMLATTHDQSMFTYRGGFLLVALLTAIVVAAASHPDSALGSKWALGSGLLVAIGIRSYALYLVHWPIYALLRPRIDVGWSWGVTLAVRLLLTVIAAELCFRLVERPWHQRDPSVRPMAVIHRFTRPQSAGWLARGTAIVGIVLLVAGAILVALPHRPDDDIADTLVAGQAALASAQGSTPAAPSGSTGSAGGGRPARDADPSRSGALPVTTPDGSTVTTPDGSTVTTPASGATGPVTLIGDSVMLGSAPEILARFDGQANVDAKVARQAAEIPPVIKYLKANGQLAETVVVQVGINGTVTTENLHDIADAVEGRRLLIINTRVPRSWEAGNNSEIKRTVRTLDNASVIDWYKVSDQHRDWFLSDGVHLDDAGRAAYADLIHEAVVRRIRSDEQGKEPKSGKGG